MIPFGMTRIIDGASCTWTVADPDAKLTWRAALPGASCFDRVAHTLRALQAGGATAIDLLPLALPASWMVNAKASSRAMQRWLAPPAIDVWAALLERLSFNLAPAEWLAMASSDREPVAQAIEALATGADGASLAAVTKVLALLRPQLVPLMDDAALWFALESVPEPSSADVPSAPASMFVPMLDWFAREVVSSEEGLIAIAVRHDRAVLDAAQTLDRLLWIESWGHRLRDTTAPDTRAPK
jgi:hypothetical protein